MHEQEQLRTLVRYYMLSVWSSENDFSKTILSPKINSPMPQNYNSFDCAIAGPMKIIFEVDAH